MPDLKIAQQADFPNDTRNDRDNLRWLIGCCAGLALLVLAVCWSATEGSFLRWDDDVLITRNPELTGLSVKSVRWAFLESTGHARYHPLMWLTWLGIKEVAGLEPFYFHLAAVLMHTLNTMLVFLLLQWCLMLAALPPAKASRAQINGFAALGALLWALHPLRGEVVSWVAAYGFTQALFFMFVACLAYLAAQSPHILPVRRRWLMGLALMSYGLSLFTFPVALGLVVIMLALDYYPLRRLPADWRQWWTPASRAVLLEKLPFLGVALLVAGIGLWVRLGGGHQRGGTVTLQEFGVAERAMQAAYLWGYYLWKPWVSADICPISTELIAFNPWSFPFVASALAVMGGTVFFYHARQRWPTVWSVWVFHLAIMLPMLGITEHPHFPSDRYSYAQGFFWSVLLLTIAWVTRDRLYWRTLIPALLVGLILLEIPLIQLQINTYRTTGTLMRRALLGLEKNDPYYVSLQYRLGCYYMDTAQYREAEDMLGQVIQARPQFAPASNQLHEARQQLRATTDGGTGGRSRP